MKKITLPELGTVELTKSIEVALEKNKKYSYLGIKVKFLIWAALNAPKRGIVAEFGVYAGGNGMLLNHLMKQDIHLFDSFEGFSPKVDLKDNEKHLEGKFHPQEKGISFEDIIKAYKPHPRVHIHKGYFSETMRLIKNKKIALAHVDADVYSSTKEVLEFILPRMAKGGIILLDDYKYWETPGVFEAVDELMETSKIINCFCQSGCSGIYINDCYI